jgi:hypothetical protein
MHVARQPVELGDSDRAGPSVAAGFGQGGGELRAAIERVRAFPRLDLDNGMRPAYSEIGKLLHN